MCGTLIKLQGDGCARSQGGAMRNLRRYSRYALLCGFRVWLVAWLGNGFPGVARGSKPCIHGDLNFGECLFGRVTESSA